jgi:hypothetical protein
MPLQALVGAAIALVVIGAGVSLWSGRRVSERRTVLLHVPADRAWEVIRHFPSVHSGHARARGSVVFDRYLLKRGDGAEAGSVWRAEGLWGGAPYWADVEIARSIPQREISVRLLRDSLGTHRGLAEHLGTLSIQPNGPGTTKLGWVLRARLKGPRLRMAQILDPVQVKMRLLDIGLRSLKVSMEAAQAASVGAIPGPPSPVPLGATEKSGPRAPQGDAV